MSYYDLTKEERKVLKQKIEDLILSDLRIGENKNIQSYSSDDDTYLRKIVYLTIGKLYKDNEKQRNYILNLLGSLYQSKDEKVRQTAIYASGEIGKFEFDSIQELLEQAFSDSHHSVLNALTGALKQLGEKNPVPTIAFVKAQLQSVDSQVRAKLLHGLELRGRTHPNDVLPILAKYQNDPEKKVKDTIIHILGQISYKKGCLKQVISSLKGWENTELVYKALEEILIVHQNYRRFSFLSPEEAQELIRKEFNIA
jgi:hypothetical protein